MVVEREELMVMVNQRIVMTVELEQRVRIQKVSQI